MDLSAGIGGLTEHQTALTCPYFTWNTCKRSPGMICNETEQLLRCAALGVRPPAPACARWAGEEKGGLAMSDDLDFEKRRPWTSHQWWTFILTAAALVVSVVAVVAQFYLAL